MNRLHKILKCDIIKGRDNNGIIHEGIVHEIKKNGIYIYTDNRLIFIKFSNILEAWNIDGKTYKFK